MDPFAVAFGAVGLVSISFGAGHLLFGPRGKDISKLKETVAAQGASLQAIEKRLDEITRELRNGHR